MNEIGELTFTIFADSIISESFYLMDRIDRYVTSNYCIPQQWED